MSRLLRESAAAASAETRIRSAFRAACRAEAFFGGEGGTAFGAEFSAGYRLVTARTRDARSTRCGRGRNRGRASHPVRELVGQREAHAKRCRGPGRPLAAALGQALPCADQR